MLALALSLNAALHAQAPPLQYTELAFPYTSGRVFSPTATWEVVDSTTVRVQGAAWLRLNFGDVRLAGPVEGESRAKLRITSHLDGAVQELDARAVREWRHTSAYFNGGTVQLEVLSCDPDEPSGVELRSVWAGHLGTTQFSQCGASDDRVASSDPRLGRLMPTTCTGWMIDDCNHCFLTAGHCTAPTPALALTAIEFNVPTSLSNGALQHPSPDDQYAIDPASFQFANNGVGDDFCYFGCFPNSNTGLSPFEAQGSAFVLAASPPPFDPSIDLRVTGYGTDSTPPDANQTQQTSNGPYFAWIGPRIRYEIDTEGGNSGSPVIEESTGLAIGIHTHGGCTTGNPSNANWGTAISENGLQAALATPLGVCAPVGTSTTYCTAKVNSLGCTPTLFGIGAASESGATSFIIRADQLLNQRMGFVFFGSVPFGAPFMGGLKCVRAPTERTGAQSTGGAPTGTSCTGQLDVDFGAYIASGVDPSLVCGAIVYAQVWSRDPTDPYTVSLTAGLRFTIGS